jgi:hypothetical protein
MLETFTYKTFSYHGTSPVIVDKILKHGISVLVGGGELGQGFYTGEHLHEAKTWAYQKSKSKKLNVIKFVHDDTDILNLDIKDLNYKQDNKTRNYTFNVDLVWSPIVGTDRVNGIQYKWESTKSEILLNSSKTRKNII